MADSFEGMLRSVTETGNPVANPVLVDMYQYGGDAFQKEPEELIAGDVAAVNPLLKDMLRFASSALQIDPNSLVPIGERARLLQEAAKVGHVATKAAQSNFLAPAC